MKEHFDRVVLMSSGDPTWDLSPNDIAALKAILDELVAARACVIALREA